MPEFAALAFDSSAYSRRTFCSWSDAGWRSMLVQVYDDDPVVEHVELPPSGDQHLVLMLGGSSTIESGTDGRWRHADYARGDVGMTTPGRPTLVRWRATSDEPLSTLHAHIPHETLRRIADEMWHGASPQADALSISDPLLEQTLLGPVEAARAGAPDLYAETAAEYLAAHVLLRHGNVSAPAPPAGSDARAARALQFMRDNLHLPLTLGQIAAEAGLSPFHFLRVFKTATGHTPLRHSPSCASPRHAATSTARGHRSAISPTCAGSRHPRISRRRSRGTSARPRPRTGASAAPSRVGAAHRRLMEPCG